MQIPSTQINCPNCRRPFPTQLEQLIDVSRDPQSKARLLSGRTNLATCPHCGSQTMISTPIMYHDPDNELLLVYIPMELNLPQQESNKLVGSMSQAITNSLPPEKRKGYLFTPKMMLSMQGMIELILEKDGITKEVLEAQRSRMRLIEQLLQTDPTQLPEVAQQHDAEIDKEFFAVLTASAESMIASGRRDVAEAMLFVREQLLNSTTAGQALAQKAGQQEEAIQTVANALNALGEKASYDDLTGLVFQLAEQGGDEYLQVLVGLARPMLDYQFFQTLVNQVDNSPDAGEKAAMLEIRDRLLELTSMVDKQNEDAIRNATEILRSLMSSTNLDEVIESRLELFDDTFLAVLSANIQAAEQAADINTSARLKMIFDKVVGRLRESAPPAVKYINELLQMPPADATANLQTRAAEFGPELVQWMDMLAQDLAQRGGAPILDRLMELREEAAKVLAI